MVPLGNGWAVKGEGNSRYTAITEKKGDARIIAENIAQSNNSEIIIHHKDGKIMSRKSHSACTK